jgi:hypothetical protein
MLIAGSRRGDLPGVLMGQPTALRGIAEMGNGDRTDGEF